MTAIGEGFSKHPITGERQFFRVAKHKKPGRWDVLPWELVPIRVVDSYREYDFYDLREPDEVQKLAESIVEQGWREPLMLEYYSKDKRVLLGEGNHRLHAALQLGLTHVPVWVYVKHYEGEGKYRSKRSRANKRISNGLPTSGYIPQELAPSVIGVRGAFPVKTMRLEG